MANYYGFARSNYFRVKDLEKFEKAMEHCCVEIVHPDKRVKSKDGTYRVEKDERLVGLLSNDEGGWCSGYCDEASGDSVDIDISGIVAEHLLDGEVAIFMSIGYEKLRYLTGDAVAVNNRGETVAVDLAQIYRQAATMGKNITRAEY